MTDVTPAQVPSPDRVAESLDLLIGVFTAGPTDVAGFAHRVAPYGWSPQARPTMITTTLPLDGQRLLLEESADRVVGGTVSIIKAGPAASLADATVTDAFASYAATLTERWGAATERKRGAEPFVRWVVRDAVVTLSKLMGGLIASVYTTAGFVELKEMGSIE